MKQLAKLSYKNIVHVLFCVCLFVFVNVFVMSSTSSKASWFLSTIRPWINFVQEPKNGTKYILSWHNYYLIFHKRRSIFPDLNCAINNCVFTYQRSLLNGDYIYYDAILFNDYHPMLRDMPKRRSQNQLYIYTSIESSLTHPVCGQHNDNFYNWTFTLRFDSTVIWKYFVVRNFSGDVIAPALEPNWQSNASRIRPDIMAVIRRKKLAAAWLVSHCFAESGRDEFARVLHDHLMSFSLSVDAYGNCSGRMCPNDDCDDMLRNNYFFYLAFENSLSTDYVSEKVLHGYKNYAVPIVYGGANYSRYIIV